jgi:K+-transporting ATPase KdpF subunit
VGWENAIALVISIAVLVYLVYALLAPEKVG